MMREVLVADDDPLARDFLAECLALQGIAVKAVPDAAQAYRLVTEQRFDLVITDLRMPGDDGLSLLRKIRLSGRDTPVVVLTAYGSVDTAVRALKEGAIDFITKPLSPEQVESLLERLSARLELPEVEREMPCRDHGKALPLIGRSTKMRELIDTAIRVARSKATVLITGESGTGKELFARLIHEESPRAKSPFVRVNCAALAETLLESELFGHEKGAFTGAIARREGRFELASGGTLFLDEIGETSPALQAKLLRVLEEREFERVGGTRTLTCDVRCVAATNRKLEDAIASGRFREDLYYRLQVVTLRIPPLRERRDDVEPLARHFLHRYARENGAQVKDFTPEALLALKTWGWPGNVRELENTIERAVVLDPGPRLAPEHLAFGDEQAAPKGPDLSSQVGWTLEDCERSLILRTLESTGNRRKDAAKILGVTARTLTNKIARYRRLGIHVGSPLRRPVREAEREAVIGRTA